VLTDLAVIRAARDMGFTVAEIRKLFHDFPAEADASARWHVLARRKITELDERISHAERMRTTLTESLACGCVTFGECPLIANGTA
jgi:MerR family redox-sensitive transcriptional activator SoxR